MQIVYILYCCSIYERGNESTYLNSKSVSIYQNSCKSYITFQFIDLPNPIDSKWLENEYVPTLWNNNTREGSDHWISIEFKTQQRKSQRIWLVFHHFLPFNISFRLFLKLFSLLFHQSIICNKIKSETAFVFH